MIRERLEHLAQQVEREIRETGCLVVTGVTHNGRHQTNPWKGLCRPAIEKLRELSPDLNIERLAFHFGKGGLDTHTHVIGQLQTDEGTYQIDPTIRQYINDVPLVYGPLDLYPIQMHPDSLRIF